MGALFKMFDDRQFCNGHRTVTMGKPVGYIIDGHLSALDSSDEAYSAITREQLVYVDENKVLINNEGMRVKLVKDEDDNLTAQYDTVVAEDGNEYMIQVDNNGQEINRILVEVSAEPEN